MQNKNQKQGWVNWAGDKGQVMQKGEIKGMNRNTALFAPVTFCLSGENLSLSQDALSSVPNGAVRGFTWAFAWLSGDVALLPLKSQNQRDERADQQEADAQRPQPSRPSSLLLLTMNDFPAQNFRNIYIINIYIIASFEPAYLLESSPPKKLECGAYGLVGFSSTSSWLNNPAGRRRWSITLTAQLSTTEAQEFIHSLMKTKSERERECVCPIKCWH